MTIGPPNPHPWPQGRRCALVVSVDFDGPSPYLWRSRDEAEELLGELEQRRFGPRVGFTRLLRIFEERRIRASVFVPGAIAQAFPDHIRAAVAGGHEIGLHGFMHEPVHRLSRVELEDILGRSSTVLTDLGAAPPLGYRSPSWEMTPDAWGVLVEQGVAYDSSLMGGDRPYWLAGLVEVPVQWTLDDAVFLRYTSASSRFPIAPEELVQRWRVEIAAAKRFHTLVVITVHPWLSGRGPMAAALDGLIDEASRDQDIWVATASEVASHHRRLDPRTEGDPLRPREM